MALSIGNGVQTTEELSKINNVSKLPCSLPVTCSASHMHKWMLKEVRWLTTFYYLILSYQYNVFLMINNCRNPMFWNNNDSTNWTGSTCFHIKIGNVSNVTRYIWEIHYSSKNYITILFVTFLWSFLVEKKMTRYFGIQTWKLFGKTKLHSGKKSMVELVDIALVYN
jgi:hypothetical protein